MPPVAPAHPEPTRRKRLTPARLEAFSDGVIAVIITIMVLELKVPHANGLAGLREVVPTLLVYLLSFSFVSIYWVNHHLLVSRVEEIDPHTLYTNLLFLFSLSLLPFSTAWLVEKDHTGFAVRLAQKLSSHDLTEQHKHLLSLVLYGIALLLSLRLPLAALLVDAVVTLVWIRPHLGAYHVPHPEAASPSTHRPA